MIVPIFQVDAFTEKAFGGNPAAVCPIDEWLPDATMQSIAAENNLSETAFCVAEEGGYGLRWFTPVREVDLCGHATLAAAFVLFAHREADAREIRFMTKSGALIVSRDGELLVMDFPALRGTPINAPTDVVDAVGAPPLEAFAATDYNPGIG